MKKNIKVSVTARGVMGYFAELLISSLATSSLRVSSAVNGVTGRTVHIKNNRLQEDSMKLVMFIENITKPK